MIYGIDFFIYFELIYSDIKIIYLNKKLLLYT